MPVKVETTHSWNQPYKFPAILRDPETELIVLLTEPGVGTVLKGGTTRYDPGYYGRNWIMAKLTPFVGRVQLENA